ncbi:MAG: hypothetical protein KGZ35_07510 [Truepera sp.]|nr:hypothetical protein [Truepera sp.]
MTKIKHKIIITREQDLPDFDAMTREQEASWWETHDLAEHLWEDAPELAELLPVDASRR